MRPATLGIVLLVAVAAAALFGLAVKYRSEPPGVPAGAVNGVPGSLVGGWVQRTLNEVKSRLGVAVPATATPVSSSELRDYEFQLLTTEFKAGSPVVVTARILHKPSGRSVPDAVLFARRLDMAPAGMPTMIAPLEPEPPAEPGTYAFKTNLAMEGGWQLSLAAKVQGQQGTVQTRLVLKAIP